MKRLLARLSSVLLALAALGAHAAAAPIHLKAYRSLVNLASPQFSPDGTRIAVIAIKPDFVHDRYDRTLLVVDAAGGAPTALVRGMRDLAMPRWSPDGRTLSFIARVGKRKSQV